MIEALHCPESFTSIKQWFYLDVLLIINKHAGCLLIRAEWKRKSLINTSSLILFKLINWINISHTCYLINSLKTVYNISNWAWLRKLFSSSSFRCFLGYLKFNPNYVDSRCRRGTFGQYIFNAQHGLSDQIEYICHVYLSYWRICCFNMEECSEEESQN